MQVLIDSFNLINMNSDYLCLLRLISVSTYQQKDFAILGWPTKAYGNPKGMGIMALGI